MRRPQHRKRATEKTTTVMAKSTKASQDPATPVQRGPREWEPVRVETRPVTLENGDLVPTRSSLWLKRVVTTATMTVMGKSMKHAPVRRVKPVPVASQVALVNKARNLV
jgi:hypothetical protein